MNTNTDNPYRTPHQAPRQQGSRAALYTSIGAAGLAAVGLVTALVLGLGGTSTANASSTPDHQQTHSDVRPAVLPTPTPTPTPTPAPAPAVAPSPTIRLLQTQLAQLNYYMGPINGIDSTQVHQAISYLQRDADLPQTGQLTPATQAALSRMLVRGNNQMSGS
jgi:hypothetical protein